MGVFPGLTVRSAAVHVWIDIENPPQVQYLLPFRRAFEEAGAVVTVTARDYDFTYTLLEERGVPFTGIGAHFGAGKLRKVLGVLRRAAALRAHFRGRPKPTALVCAGRASVLAARTMGTSSFVFGDYEYTDASLYRYTGSHIVFPDVIDSTVHLERGFPEQRLMPYRGLKEDITFAGLDLDAVPAHRFPELDGSRVAKVLFRPPAEESHYYRDESGDLALATLERLAALDDAVVVFSPRYPRQVEYLRRFSWRTEPVVLHRAVPFLSLLKGVDAVISGGGTMLREAAYLGVPAYTIFRGTPGGVDRHLEAIGRLHVIAGRDDLRDLTFAAGARRPLLAENPGLLDELAQAILARAGAS
jgi:predicted glycosyltransferase